MNKETGGTAFPALHWVAPQGHTANENPQGMTLRDYFAAKAMQAILSENPDYHQRHYFLDLADFSYQCADAMLKAREQ